MKKYLVTAAGYALAFGLSAQTTLQNIPEAPKALNLAERTSDQGYTSTRSGGNAPTALNGDTILWETFGNGFAGDGSNGAWSHFIVNNPSASLDWEYRGTGTNPNNTTGSRGAYNGQRGPIASPTVSNGFMIFDSDYLDNNGNPGVFGTGPLPTPHIGVLETPTMDFTGYQSIYLRMTSYFRRYQATCHVAFSTDGGMTYSDTIDIYDDDFAINSSTQNAELIYVPIPFNIPGNNNVKAQFIFDGATVSNATSSGYYFWQIDDIQFVQGPDNNLSLDDNFFNWGSNQGQNYYYANIPLKHANTDTVSFSGELTNQGSQTLTNNRVDVFFNGSLETQTTSNPSLATGNSDSLGNSGNVIMNKPTGNYSIDFVANSDSTDDFPSNDTTNFNLNITDDVYSRADNNITIDQGDFYPGYNYSIGFSMTIKQPDTLKSVDIYFSIFSAQNAQVQVCVWDANLNNLTASDPNSFYNLGSADIGAWSNYDITDIYLTPGDYIVGFKTFGDTVSMAQGQPGADPGTVLVRPDNNAAQSWSFTTSMNPKIKANVAGGVCDVALGNDTAYCAGDAFNITLDAGIAGATYNWSDSSTNQTLAVDTAGTYWVEVANTNGCVSTDTLEVTENALPTAALGNDTAYCSGDAFSITLDAGNAGATYNWSDNSNNQTLAVDTAGTYWVEVTNANGCVGTDTLEVTEDTIPMADLGNDTAYCVGDAFSISLDAGIAGATYNWSDSSTNQTLAVDTVGTYWVEVTNANGCVGTDTLEVTENALPMVDLGNDTAYCAGDAFSITLDAGNAGASYNWSDNSTGQTLTVNTAGTYWVEVTNASGCFSIDTLEVTENALPTVELGNDTAYCVGDAFSITLNAGNAGATYNWSDNSTNQTLAIDTAGIYSISVTNANGCVGIDTLEVTENSGPPMIDLGNDTAYCAGYAFNITLDASNAGATYSWSDNSMTPTLAVDTAGSYSVTVTNGCSSSADTLEVTENASPIVDLGIDTAYCVGDAFSITLNAGNAGATYNWSDNSTSQTLAVDTAGTYWVEVANTNGCVSTDTLEVTENALPTLSLGNDTSYCVGDAFNITLDAGNAGSTYNWSDNSTNQTLAVDTAGTYWVEVTNANGCVSTDTLEVTENTLPMVSLGNDTAYCAGDAFSITLDASNSGATYNWSDNSTGQTLTVNTAGTYWVEVTNAGGCVSTDTLEVTENALPMVDLGNDTAYCAGDAFSITLDAGNAGASYNWSDNSTGQTLTVNTAGTYWVEVTNANGCVSTDTLEVTESSVPTVSLNDADICADETATLDAGAGFASYDWSNGETTQTITVSTDDTYDVTVTNASGCEREASAVVTVNPLPVVDLGNDTTMSPGYTITLDAGSDGDTYNWNTGETTQTIDVEYGDVPSDFSVEVTSAEVCVSTDTIFIDANTGVRDLVKGSIKLYPNPTRGNAKLDITLTEGGEMMIEVHSISGQLLDQVQYGASAGQQIVPVEMSNYENGMYIINVKLNDESISQFNVTKM